MADRQHIRVPQEVDCAPLRPPVIRFFQQIARLVNAVTTDIVDMPTYADNAAALAGGLVVGDLYHTAAGEVRIVV